MFAYPSTSLHRPRRLVTSVAAAFILGIVLMGCSTIAVTTNHDSSANFDTYRNYAWSAGMKPFSGDIKPEFESVIGERIKAAVEKELDEKHFAKLEPERASMFVAYHVVLTDKNYTPEEYSSHQFDRDMADNDFKQGTLIIDFIDAEDGRLIWRGSATGAVTREPSESGNKAKEAVRKILLKYPPR